MEDLIKNQLIKTLNNRFLAKEQTELLFSAGASGLDPEWLRAISLDHFCKEKNTLDTSKIADA